MLATVCDGFVTEVLAFVSIAIDLLFLRLQRERIGTLSVSAHMGQLRLVVLA